MAVTAPGRFRERGLERREVEKRIYGVERGAAHGFRVLSDIKIPRDFEHRINQMKTNIDEFMNILTQKDETFVSSFWVCNYSP